MVLEILFICTMGSVTKEIKAGVFETRAGKECRTMLDLEKVGSAKNDMGYCKRLGIKVSRDMTRKGYACKETSAKA